MVLAVSGPSLWVRTYRLGITKGGLGVAPFLGSSLARKRVIDDDGDDGDELSATSNWQ
jgi:hypothetical protein